MALVHGGFRRELHNAADLICGVHAGDTKRAKVIADHIDFMMTAVHFHHSAEDEFVWPHITSSAAARTAELTRMEAAHRDVDDVSAQIRPLATRWARTGTPHDGEELVSHIDGLVDLVDAHFDDEEQHVVPLIAEHLSPKAWQKFLSHGSSFVRAHPRRGLALGGIVLDGAPIETRRRFLGNLPLPLRVVFTSIGDRVYAGYRNQVYAET